ncbi:helix-turn-helix domain-containing protein [Paraglaciecola arctica]|uniref:helix-turn-helix domain-containing protein n=1 Tax=Paraglaciecola arctica TaxID=1128911 RepID=UPI00339D53F9
MVLVERLGNISEASRQSDISRDTINGHLKLVKQGGADALKRHETPNIRHKNCIVMEIEKAVIEFSLEHPHLRQQKLTEVLRIDVSPNGVRSIWLRNDMNTTAQRVKRTKLIRESA